MGLLCEKDSIDLFFSSAVNDTDKFLRKYVDRKSE